METALPREIIGEILAESKHRTTSKLLGRGWRDLRTREQLEEELKRPIEAEDLLRYSRETGNDFRVYGRSFDRKIQEHTRKLILDPYAMRDDYYSYRNGFFMLKGNTETLTELYSYEEIYNERETIRRKYLVKKKSPISDFSEKFRSLVYPLAAIYSGDVEGVIFDDDQGYEKVILAEKGLSGDTIAENYLLREGRLPVYAWSDDKEITVEGIKHVEYLDDSLYFYGRSDSQRNMYLDPQIADYILRKRVSDQIPVVDAVINHRVKYDSKFYMQLFELDDDPRQEIETFTVLN
jgi:hypothetical protein